MPSYFYHIALELIYPPPSSQSSLRGASPSWGTHHNSADGSSFLVAYESACEALRPFQRRSHQQHQQQQQQRHHHSKQPNRDGRQAVVSSSSSFSSSSTSQWSSPTATATSYQTESKPALLEYPDRIVSDPRLDELFIECIDMVSSPSPQHEMTTTTTAPSKRMSKPTGRSASSTYSTDDKNPVTTGIGTDILGGLRTKGRYVPLDRKVSDSVWGIVHLYRDAQDTPYLALDDHPTYLKGSAAAVTRQSQAQPYGDGGVIRTVVGRSSVSDSAAGSGNSGSGSGSGSGSSHAPIASSGIIHPDEDCTTLCVLAVPAYLSPSDFLGFVGESTMDQVSHFRMIRTARANRYMVLMKFRNAKRAREWQREWNGKVFNSMEPETCHVVFVKTVEIQAAEASVQAGGNAVQPSLASGSQRGSVSGAAGSTSLGSAPLSSKPLAPPTPALVELPTCPVCLERMDETTGLLTIICQHVFHCTCLQKWKGSGCPVCRYTQDDFRRGSSGGGGGGSGALLDSATECRVCHSEDNLWVCLICGNVGCGRYDGAHAMLHFKETAHAFAMDLATQRVWDYVGDAYVHRIIQSKTDGKLVELPAADDSALDPPDWTDAVPREKLENISVEYTHLLTSQLESQRAYFEEIVERAADKASRATAAATKAHEAAEHATSALRRLQGEYDKLTGETLANLERDKTRAEKRAEKFESMARRFEKDWREEKTVNESLMERIGFLTAEVEALKASNADLAEQNRDLTFFISGSERLKGQGEDVTQGTVSVPEQTQEAGGGKGKGKKGKGRKK